MKKYIKYIALILLIIMCLIIAWYFFIRKNPTIDEYEKKITEKVNIINSTQIENPDNIDSENNNPDENSTEIQKPIIDDIKIKPNDNPVIISSETKVLNEKGQELLDQLSKELEQSLQTISTTDGTIDDDILNTEEDINLGE